MSQIDPAEIIAFSNDNVSNQPVRTARYIIEIVMNENDPDDDAEMQKKLLSDEFQRALDDNYFADCRYDAITFNVVSREVLHTAEANCPDDN